MSYRWEVPECWDCSRAVFTYTASSCHCQQRESDSKSEANGSQPEPFCCKFSALSAFSSELSLWQLSYLSTWLVHFWCLCLCTYVSENQKLCKWYGKTHEWVKENRIIHMDQVMVKHINVFKRKGFVMALITSKWLTESLNFVHLFFGIVFVCEAVFMISKNELCVIFHLLCYVTRYRLRKCTRKNNLILMRSSFSHFCYLFKSLRDCKCTGSFVWCFSCILTFPLHMNVYLASALPHWVFRQPLWDGLLL